MKFGLIFSGNDFLIEVMRIPSKRFDIFIASIDNLSDFNEIVIGSSLKVEFSQKKAKEIMTELLNKREEMPYDVPDYKGRFSEEEVFVNKEIFGKYFKLCNTGFDNDIIFLSNLLDKDNEISHVLIADSYKGISKINEQ